MTGWDPRAGCDPAARPAVACPGEVYQNEFAMVLVSRVRTPTGVRLSIRDLASDAQITLDPLELEALTRLRHGDFAAFVDPSGFAAMPEPDPDQV